jgi:hypothetical protein
VKYPLFGAALLALAACGAEREAPRTDTLENVRGFLARTFSARGPEGGGLCGDPFLVGEKIDPIPGPGVCGVDAPVALRAVGGVTLSQTATIDCDTARALRRWIDESAGPALEPRGGLTELKVAAHYVCRTRNHQPGARISEHGKGRAIDISAFRLADGSEITVTDGWRSERDGPLLRRLHRDACGPFGTVLGPESDRWHQNHFHFDTAQHRGGPYCR